MGPIIADFTPLTREPYSKFPTPAMGCDDRGMDSHDSARTRALAAAVREIEKHVSTLGWDRETGVFALAKTSQLLSDNPLLADQIDDGGPSDPEHLTSIAQEDLPASETLTDLLAQLAWPDSVSGVAVSVERVVLPPSAEEDMPADPEAGEKYLMNHPDREDVRIVAGVLRSGESWCVLRARSHDFDDAVASDPNAVPDLLEALAATLE